MVTKVSVSVRVLVDVGVFEEVVDLADTVLLFRILGQAKINKEHGYDYPSAKTQKSIPLQMLT